MFNQSGSDEDTLELVNRPEYQVVHWGETYVLSRTFCETPPNGSYYM